MAIRFLRGPEVAARMGRARSTRYVDIDNGLMTRGVAVGRRSVGWPAHEVEAINTARIAGKTDDEIREIVARLLAVRATLQMPCATPKGDDPQSQDDT